MSASPVAQTAPITAPLYAAAADLDRRLGDPCDADNPYGFGAMARRDAAAATTTLAKVARPELRSAFVPVAHGGTLRGVDDTLMLARAVSRRDATVMPATMFGITATTAVLVAGTPEQRSEVVKLGAAGRSIGFALTEREHDDVLAGTCALVPDPTTGGYRLTGRKWRVGLGPRCEALLVLARTGERGPAAFTLVLLRAQQLVAARRGRLATDGMRGVEFADLHFDNVPVPAANLVGGVGRGMEITLRAMQLVRVTSTAANLGTADTALRLTLDHAAPDGTGLDSTEIADPYVRRELGVAAAALVAIEASALPAARALHALPEQQSLWSSLAKRVATDLSAEVFSRCADVLGFRSVLAGPFAVAQRDNAMVRHIDTDPVGNLRLAAQQLRRLATAAATTTAAAAGGEPGTDAVRAVFTLDAPLPEFDPAALVLSWRGGEAVGAALSRLLPELHLGDEVVRDAAAAVAAGLADVLAAVGRPVTPPAAVLDLTERFAFLHAAACCVLLWWHNRHLPLFGRPPGSIDWFTAAVELLLARAEGSRYRPEPEAVAGLLSAVRALHADGRLFAAVPTPLGEAAP